MAVLMAAIFPAISMCSSDGKGRASLSSSRSDICCCREVLSMIMIRLCILLMMVRT